MSHQIDKLATLDLNEVKPPLLYLMSITRTQGSFHESSDEDLVWTGGFMRAKDKRSTSRLLKAFLLWRWQMIWLQS